jgi:enolase-phosphatase E1
MNFKILLVDVEGTTTKISFVKESLFPFVLQNINSFLTTEFENIQPVLADLQELSREFEGFQIDFSTKQSTISTTITFVTELMAADKKVAALKNLQGIMWKSAYEQDLVKGHVYDDVVDCLERCKKASKPVYIYSSGSVFAQKLLFKYSVHGDLSAFISGNFDTVNAGLKTESGSYTIIFKDLQAKHGLESPSEILFLTDNIIGTVVLI